MVWETHEVREETNRLWFVSLYLLPLFLLTSNTRQDTRRLLTHQYNVDPAGGRIPNTRGGQRLTMGQMA
jgi:hypothetical protein